MFTVRMMALSLVQLLLLIINSNSYRPRLSKFYMSSSFSSSAEYVSHLKSISALPKGFQVGATRFNFEPMEVANKILPMNLTLIQVDQPTDSFAALFTSNQYPGGPVLVGKDRMKLSSHLQAVVINNKISNVCPGGVTDRGYGDSDSICETIAGSLGLESKQAVFPSSTGIIGWRLPVQAITAALPALLQTRQRDSILPAALGIMTTDRYPKVRSYRSKNGWSIVGTAKGAGMIEPNLATMLAYLLTDLDVPRVELQSILQQACATSFNTISVDGDQSTSDTALFISSKAHPRSQNAKEEEMREFIQGVESVCQGLAEDIVRNGEGTQHVMKVIIEGLPVSQRALAVSIGKSIVNSNLVKCAIAGCDPNVGRIVGAIGSCLGNMHPDHGLKLEEMSLWLGGIEIFHQGAFLLDPAKEKLLSDYMFDCQLFPNDSKEHDRDYQPHDKCVELIVKFPGSSGSGSGDSSSRVQVIGSDLTKEYVEVNADYRS